MAYNDPNNPLVNKYNKGRKWIKQAEEIQKNWGFDIATNDNPMPLLKPPSKRNAPMVSNAASRLYGMSILTPGRGVAMVARLLELSKGDHVTVRALELLTEEQRLQQHLLFPQSSALLNRRLFTKVDEEAGRSEDIPMTVGLQTLASLRLDNANSQDDDEEDASWHAQSSRFNPRLHRMFVKEMERFVRINAVRNELSVDIAEGIASIHANASDRRPSQIQYEISQMGQRNIQRRLASASARNENPKHADSRTGVTGSPKSGSEGQQSPQASPRSSITGRSKGSLSPEHSQSRRTPTQTNEATIPDSALAVAATEHASMFSFRDQASSDMIDHPLLGLSDPDVVPIRRPQALEELEVALTLAARNEDS
ncbi:hypothetical protein MMC18_004046 [Xylographa bjoerkii]|nr:hypothetical protein [Xylographa bjoerkii]